MTCLLISPSLSTKTKLSTSFLDWNYILHYAFSVLDMIRQKNPPLSLVKENEIVQFYPLGLPRIFSTVSVPLYYFFLSRKIEKRASSYPLYFLGIPGLYRWGPETFMENGLLTRFLQRTNFPFNLEVSKSKIKSVIEWKVIPHTEVSTSKLASVTWTHGTERTL